MNLTDALNGSKSHTIEVHFEAELLDVVGVLPGAIMLEKLTTTVLTFVALPPFAITVLSSGCSVTVRTVHFS
jgi:hypothetical protein